MKKDKAKADASKDVKKQPTAISPALKAVIRPLLLVRKFRLNYGETNSTTYSLVLHNPLTSWG
jgi:hypothetical protein